MLSQHIKPELARVQEKQADKAEYNPDSKRILGCKFITARQLNRDILQSNRYKKVQSTTIAKMVLNKTTVRDTLVSLRDINRKILAANDIKERVDDFIYLSIKME